jgi:hypothetical protein
MHALGRVVLGAAAVVAIAFSPASFAGFSPSGNMSLGQGGRYGAFAAKLPDGSVLYAGGFNGVSLATAEIYHPDTGTFSATTNGLTAARGFGRTVTLQDGRILLVGGGAYDESGAVANVDIYDPSSGLFVPTGSMQTPRVDMVAVRLQDGKVLVAGGMAVDGSTRLASAELYDPTTGLFTPTGSMQNVGDNRVAALLANGKVLVAGGGVGTGVSHREAELYDPASGTFSATGNMSVGRDDATATVLPNGKVLIAGGANNDVPVPSADIYDPATGTFTQSQSTLPERDYASAVLLSNNLVLIVGGQGNTNGLGDTGALSDAVTYDYTTDTFTSAGTMATARFYTPAIALDNASVLIAGGYNNDGVVSASELFSYAFVDEIFANGFEGP